MPRLQILTPAEQAAFDTNRVMILFTPARKEADCIGSP